MYLPPARIDQIKIKKKQDKKEEEEEKKETKESFFFPFPLIFASTLYFRCILCFKEKAITPRQRTDFTTPCTFAV